MILMTVFNRVPEHFIGYMSHFHMLIIFDLDKKKTGLPCENVSPGLKSSSALHTVKQCNSLSRHVNSKQEKRIRDYGFLLGETDNERVCVCECLFCAFRF